MWAVYSYVCRFDGYVVSGDYSWHKGNAGISHGRNLN